MLAKKINEMKAQYNVSKIEAFTELIHSMVMCLIVDFHLESAK